MAKAQTLEVRITSNAAAMREALKESTAILAVVRGDEYEEDITRQIDRNTDALAAPVRNCDRFQTAAGAEVAWMAYPPSPCKGCRVCPNGRHLTLVEWLFAPAVQ